MVAHCSICFVWRLTRTCSVSSFTRILKTLEHYNKQVREYVVVFGGSANNIHYNDMWMYDVTGNVWFEDFPSSDMPMARDGHSMVLLASPEMRETMKKATTKTMKAKQRRRRLLGLEDLPFLQTPIDYAKLRQHSLM